MKNDETAALLISAAEKWGAPMMVVTPYESFGNKSGLRVSLGNNKDGDEIIIVHPLETQGLAHALHVVPADRVKKSQFIESLIIFLSAALRYDEISKDSDAIIPFARISSLAYHFLQLAGVDFKTLNEAAWIPNEAGFIADIPGKFEEEKVRVIRCGPDIRVNSFEIEKPSIAYTQISDEKQALLLRGSGPYPQATLAAAIGRPVGNFIDIQPFELATITDARNEESGLLIISKISTRILS